MHEMKALVRLILAALVLSASAQEITLEEVKVESTFLAPVELPISKTLEQFIARLRLDDERVHERELRAANKSSLTTILELTRYSPIGLGSSDPRIDTTQANYLRADLNPREKNPLFGPSPR